MTNQNDGLQQPSIPTQEPVYSFSISSTLNGKASSPPPNADLAQAIKDSIRKTLEGIFYRNDEEAYKDA